MVSSRENAFLDLIVTRRSASMLGEPGPSDAELAQLLAAAVTVPDHGQLRPFRFAVVSGEGRSRFGAALAAAALERKPELNEHALENIRGKALRSPTLIVLIASPKTAKIELWEQNATAACTGYAIVLAAHALGIGAVWKSVPFTRGASLAELFSLGSTEELIGWIHLGTAIHTAPPREPFDVSSITTVIDGGRPRPFRA
ncbi:MAG TPA: nitroreductase [Polyangiaceae bacterium]